MNKKMKPIPVKSFRKFSGLPKKLPKYGNGVQGADPNAGQEGEQKGGNTNALISAGIGITGMATPAMNDYATRADGSVNKTDYVAAKHWEYGAKGAQMGSAFGPWGSLVGGIAGHLYGVGKGMGDADKINKQVSNDKIQNEKDLETQRAQEEAFRKQQQDAYSRSYMSTNNIYGNQGTSLYPLGGTMGEPAPIKRSPQEWDAYNKQRNWAVDPRATPSSKGYNTYYDPTAIKISPSTAHESGWNVEGLKPNAVDSYGLPAASFHQGYEYQAPTTKPIINTGVARPIPQVVDPMKQSGYNGVITDPTQIAGYTKAYGGKTCYAPGGKLIPLADDTVKAEGNTHQEGGITLQANNGKPYAEVEDQEIIKDNNVYSDRLEHEKGVTYASAAEKLSKQKGEFEKDLNSPNVHTKNTAMRMTQNLDAKLKDLFEHQENFKRVNNIDSDITKKANGGDLLDAAGNLVPYADNMYNASLIKNTPKIPLPTTKVAYNETPMAMNTHYNIDPALTDANNSYQAFNKSIDNNTSNSADARNNKLAGFADLIKNKSALYGQKENAENYLKNQDSLNRQTVNGRNVNNNQTIANTNLSQKDTYNWHNMERVNSMNEAKSANVANAVEDFGKQKQDKNMMHTDQERIMLDSLKYNDAAGLSKMIGTPTMTKMINDNPEYYDKVEKSLKDSGQKEALNNFYKYHPKKK